MLGVPNNRRIFAAKKSLQRRKWFNQYFL